MQIKNSILNHISKKITAVINDNCISSKAKKNTKHLTKNNKSNNND